MGTLTTCSLSSMKNYSEIQTKYFIALRPGKVKVAGMRHRPDLAPSKELFLWTQAHKLEPDWFHTYEEWFKRDMQERPSLREAIARLELEVRQKDILLVCFCPDPSKCHRRLIAEELRKQGIKTDIQ